MLRARPHPAWEAQSCPLLTATDKADLLTRLAQARIAWHAAFDAGDLELCDEAAAALDDLLESLFALCHPAKEQA
jgi:hypothetical protein